MVGVEAAMELRVERRGAIVRLSLTEEGVRANTTSQAQCENAEGAKNKWRTTEKNEMK